MSLVRHCCRHSTTCIRLPLSSFSSVNYCIHVKCSVKANVYFNWCRDNVVVERGMKMYIIMAHKNLHTKTCVVIYSAKLRWLNWINRRVVSEEVLAGTEIPGGGGRGRLYLFFLQRSLYFFNKIPPPTIDIQHLHYYHYHHQLDHSTKYCYQQSSVRQFPTHFPAESNES